ncbi:MAG: AIM24 family protein, partial [Bacteroidota bacterium]
MKYEVSAYPSSFLTLALQPGEQIITERGTLIFAEGEYTFENKIEAKSYKNWVVKAFGGKSLAYNVYTAKEEAQLAFSPKDSAEIFTIEVTAERSIIFEPSLHFARTAGVDIVLKKSNWKNTLNDGLKLISQGEGTLFLKGYGKIIAQEIDTTQPMYLDETALIAFEDTVEVETISKGVKELITSGEGFLLA